MRFVARKPNQAHVGLYEIYSTVLGVHELVITHRRSIAERGRLMSSAASVCLFVIPPYGSMGEYLVYCVFLSVCLSFCTVTNFSAAEKLGS